MHILLKVFFYISVAVLAYKIYIISVALDNSTELVQEELTDADRYELNDLLQSLE